MKAYKILATFRKSMYPEFNASHFYYVLADSREEAEANVLLGLQKGGCVDIKLETEVIFIDDIRK